MPCWISSRDIPPRAIYADAIVEGMQSCGACAVLVSAASNASKAVKREVELASHEDKAFIPIRIDGSEPASGLAYYLRNAQWLEYKREGERILDRLIPRKESVTPAIEATPQSNEGAVREGSRRIGNIAIVIAALAITIGGVAFLAPIARTVPEPSEWYTVAEIRSSALSDEQTAGLAEWARGQHTNDITRVVVTTSCSDAEGDETDARLPPAVAAIEQNFPNRVELIQCGARGILSDWAPEDGSLVVIVFARRRISLLEWMQLRRDHRAA